MDALSVLVSINEVTAAVLGGDHGPGESPSNGEGSEREEAPDGGDLAGDEGNEHTSDDADKADEDGDNANDGEGIGRPEAVEGLDAANDTLVTRELTVGVSLVGALSANLEEVVVNLAGEIREACRLGEDGEDHLRLAQGSNAKSENGNGQKSGKTGNHDC